MRKLGAGLSSEVYEQRDGRILKLFLRECADLARDEARNLRALGRAGVPVPRLVDEVSIDERMGLVFDSPRAGRSLYDELRSKPWRTLAHARLLAQLHADVHEHSCAELPSLRDRLTQQISAGQCLPAAVQDSALEMLNRLPDSDAVCHNDLHGSNVIFADGGPVIIDWVRAERGQPLADVASTVIKYQLRRSKPGGSAALRRGAATVFGRAYLHHYRRLRPHSADQLRAWLIPIAAAYAVNREGEERSRMIAFACRQIAQIGPQSSLQTRADAVSGMAG
jgi:aminoglycoside phosphotransferase (APT) family kinase protein